MNAQNLRQRWRKRVEKIGGNSGGRGAINFEIPLRIFGGGNHVERAQRTWDEHVFNHRVYDRGGSSLQQVKICSCFFFFQLLFTSAARFHCPCNSAIYGAAVIETNAINNLQYELWKPSKKENIGRSS